MPLMSAVARILKGNSSQLYLLNGDLYFLLQGSDHYVVGNNQESLKRKPCQLLFLGNHLKVITHNANGWGEDFQLKLSELLIGCNC